MSRCICHSMTLLSIIAMLLSIGCRNRPEEVTTRTDNLKGTATFSSTQIADDLFPHLDIYDANDANVLFKV